MSEGGEARNHEADERALDTPLGARQRAQTQRDVADILEFGSPQGEDHEAHSPHCGIHTRGWSCDCHLSRCTSPERKKLIVDWTENGDPILLDPGTDPATVVGTHDLPCPSPEALAEYSSTTKEQ